MSNLPLRASAVKRVVAGGSARVRSDNLSAVLALVHRFPGISRSQLTRETGLNRSTIAALVADLADRRLVIEAEPQGEREVGRPSPIVRPDPSTVAIAVNPEIDSITIGVVALGGTVLSRRRRSYSGLPTPERAVAAASAEIADLIARLGDGHRVVGIGVAVPGLVDTDEGTVRIAPHLDWADVPLARLLADATGLPVYAANDASLGAHAERLFGAGRGVDDLIYLNGGPSGIGGGVIAAGVPLRGRAGFAGEIGHTVVSETASRDPAGSRGSLEVEVNRDALLRLLDLDDVDQEGLERALLASDDPAVRAEVVDQLHYLSIAIANAVNILNPTLVVLGGFLASLDAAAPGELARLVRSRSLAPSFADLEITRAELGPELLMIGAAELAFADLLRDPTRVGGSATPFGAPSRVPASG